MKFILTKELGRLAKWLRILGYDAEYFREAKEASLVIKALQEDRVILTRNARLGQHVGIKRLNITCDSIYEQLRQTFAGLLLRPDAALMFTRCTICNEALQGIEKEKVKDRVPQYVFKAQNDFVNCPKCQRIYWQGSHWGNVKNTLKEITSLQRG
jgi:uncharacterized protein with PIN domain